MGNMGNTKLGFGKFPIHTWYIIYSNTIWYLLYLYGGVHELWGNLTPIGTASTRGSPQTELTKKMKFRHGDHLETG